MLAFLDHLYSTYPPLVVSSVLASIVFIIWLSSLRLLVYKNAKLDITKPRFWTIDNHISYDAERNLWIDSYKNTWHGDRDKESVYAMSLTLVDCQECHEVINCKHCYGCSECIDCTLCVRCVDCSNCVKCSHCKNCNNSEKLKDIEN